ncbi:MAG TPA: TIGR03016 family PEP-CTERM system-associated outer membrane protein, partial [Pseudothauera hydrothermalis]|nr:TIGR03016 family PEP-CTERM system-associated outer membrane protein [Pseudothauera hydrothermalis]
RGAAASETAVRSLLDSARLWRQRGRDDLARAALTKLLGIEPGHREALRMLTAIEIEAERFGEAERLIARLERSADGRPQALQLRELLAAARAQGDPVVRDRLERELQALGVSRAALDEAVVSNSYFVDRRFHAGLSLIGARNLVSLTVSRSDRERLGETGFVSAQDDFSIYQRIREKSARISWTHRLSGTSALTATLTRVNAWGEGSNAASIRRTLFSLGWSARLSPRTTAGLMYRYQQASGSDDFTENAITANIAMRF